MSDRFAWNRLTLIGGLFGLAVVETLYDWNLHPPVSGPEGGLLISRNGPGDLSYVLGLYIIEFTLAAVVLQPWRGQPRRRWIAAGAAGFATWGLFRVVVGLHSPTVLFGHDVLMFLVAVALAGWVIAASLTDLNSRHTDPPEKGSIREVITVFALTVALLFVGGLGAEPGYDFGQRNLLTTLVIEAIGVAILWPWLRRRGWEFGRIAGAPVPSDVLRGLALAVVAYVAYYLTAVVWSIVVPGGFEQITSAVPAGAAAGWVVVLVSIVNPIVEEFLWLAYGFTALRRFGVGPAIGIMVGLRTLVHAYQGPMALVGILPLGLVFTYYFARTGRLWPVVVAHMLYDVVGLLAVVHS